MEKIWEMSKSILFRMKMNNVRDKILKKKKKKHWVNSAGLIMVAWQKFYFSLH